MKTRKLKLGFPFHTAVLVLTAGSMLGGCLFGYAARPRRAGLCRRGPDCDAKFEAAARDCAQVIPAYERFRPYLATPKIVQAAVRIYQCGHKEYVWHKMFLRSWAGRIMNALTEAGIDLEADLVEFLRTYANKYPNRVRTSRIARLYLDRIARKRFFAKCGQYVPLVAQLPTGLRLEFFSFWRRAGCRAANPEALRALEGGPAEERAAACRLLGVTGDQSVLRTVEAVAETDRTYVIRGLMTVFYVRDACRAAARLIRARMERGG